MVHMYGSMTLPEKYLALKHDVVKEYGRAELEKSWGEVLDELKSMTEESERAGPEIIPIVDFTELNAVSPARIQEIKKRGAVLLRNIVPDEEALKWKESLREYVKVNVVDGLPEDDKQFFFLYWSQAQVQARAHPNVLKAQTFMNELYHDAEKGKDKRYDLSTPLTYADRFRLRHPGGYWNDHKPHIDGGGIERWEDDKFRECFKDILSGNWRAHDPYDLSARLDARSSLYGRPNQSTVFRTFQGWLSLSSTAPGEGTLRVFPNVTLSNAYLILRPFFRLKEGVRKEDELEKENWEWDISKPIFPGIWYKEVPGISRGSGKLHGPRLTDETHPHLKLEKAMVSAPKVEPGDMVFWHCDVVHSVEPEHHGTGDSSVLYIPAVPTTPFNTVYSKTQLEQFKKGLAPLDFPQDNLTEGSMVGVGTLADLHGVGAIAMGLV